MLGAMRSKNNSTVIYVILGLVCLGLVGIGAAGVGGGRIRSIGTVGDEKVHVASYQSAITQTVNAMSQQLGRQLSPNDMQQFRVSERVLDTVVGNATLNNEATQAGLSLGDDWVREAILQNPQFQGLNGGFDEAIYEVTLERSLGVTPPEYDELVRKDGVRAIVQTTLAGGVDTDGTISRTLLNYAQEARGFEWITVTEADLPTPVVDPDAAALQAHYDANLDAYMSPLTREITYVWLSPAAVAAKIVIADDELRAAFDDDAGRFNTPELRSLDRLVYPDADAAEAARLRHDDGTASFVDLVAERGLEEADVALGEVARSALSAAAADVVFAAEEPGLIGPVETSLGPALIRINAILPAITQTFEDVRGTLRDELAAEQALNVISEQIPDIEDLLAADASLAEIATETDMEMGALAYTEDTAGGLADFVAFRTAARDVQIGDFAELIDLPDGGVFALQLDEERAPAQIPFDEVTSEVATDARAAAVAAAMDAHIDALSTQINDGASLADLGFADATQVEPILRTAIPQAPSLGALEAVFGAEVNTAFSASTPDARILGRVTAIAPFDPDQDGNAETFDAVKSSVNQSIAADMMSLLTTALREQTPVQLNQNAIAQINSFITGTPYGGHN